MMILLKALLDIAKANKDNIESEIYECLYNRYCDEQLKIKLKPIKTDDEQFKLLLNDNLDEMNKIGNIYENYTFFLNTIKKDNLFLLQIKKALECIEIIEIDCEEGKDDPQAVFESINSTGLSLSQADLIRNYLLMNTKNQDSLYEKHWLKIENKLKENTYYTNLNEFFRCYLVFRKQERINKNDLYKHFVDLSKEKICKELLYFAEIYASFLYDDLNY